MIGPVVASRSCRKRAERLRRDGSEPLAPRRSRRRGQLRRPQYSARAEHGRIVLVVVDRWIATGVQQHARDIDDPASARGDVQGRGNAVRQDALGIHIDAVRDQPGDRLGVLRRPKMHAMVSCPSGPMRAVSRAASSRQGRSVSGSRWRGNRARRRLLQHGDDAVDHIAGAAVSGVAPVSRSRARRLPDREAAERCAPDSSRSVARARRCSSRLMRAVSSDGSRATRRSTSSSRSSATATTTSSGSMLEQVLRHVLARPPE